MSEAELRRRFVARLKALGCHVIPLVPDASNDLDEYPDILVLGRQRLCAFVEFKRPKTQQHAAGKVRVGQKERLAFFTGLGYYARVHTSERGAAEVAREVGVLC